MTIDWDARIISVPKSDLSLVSGSLYEYDMNQFRLDLKDLEDDEAGIVFPDTHIHNPEVSISGLLYARQVLLINGYTVTFEDGQYAVNLINANTNVAENVNINQVSIRPQNSAGMVNIRDIHIMIAGTVGKAIVASDDSSVTIYDPDDGSVIVRTLNLSPDGRERTIAP